MSSLSIAFITYNELTAKYLPFFLSSLKEQSFQDFNLIVFDNSEKENKNKKYIREYFKDAIILGEGENIGFSRAYNIMIKKALELRSKYFLALNPDMILENNAIKELMKVMEADSSLASLSPKILTWDFENKRKTNYLDSCGIVKNGVLRFKDLGQGEKDNNQYFHHSILGPSGAAAFYRLSVLEKIKEGNNYFDELMFMYEEDCDLAFRLELAGFRSALVNESVIYHDRSARTQGDGIINIIKNRKNKTKNIRKWAFLNKHIIFIKYFHILKIKDKINLFYFIFKLFIFSLIFEPFLLKEYWHLFKIRKKIKRYI